MTRARRIKYGKGMAAVAFLLLLTALYLSSHKFGALFPLWVIGWVFFGSGGGASVPLRKITAVGWVFVVIGSTLMVLAAAWPWVYERAWPVLLAGWVAVVAAVLAILGSWAYLRATTEPA